MNPTMVSENMKYCVDSAPYISIKLSNSAFYILKIHIYFLLIPLITLILNLHLTVNFGGCLIHREDSHINVNQSYFKISHHESKLPYL